MIKIYGMVCPKTKEIRYIGKTTRSLQARLHNHITESKRSRHSHKHRWIAKCCDEGMRPTMWLLEEVEDGVRWQDREREWIRKARAMGLNLTNQTNGGEGMNFIDEEAKSRYLISLAAASKKAYHSNPSLREALIRGGKESWARNRQGRIDACMSGWTPEAKKAHAEKMASIRKTPEFKAAKSKAQKLVWEESRQVFMAAFSNPDCKAKQSESKKRVWRDPETRSRMMNRWTPEARAKQSQALRERQEKMKEALTPEVRAKQAATLKATWARRKAAKT